MRNILIVGSGPVILGVAQTIRDLKSFGELFFLPGSHDTKKIGTNIKIKHFGRRDKDDCKEIGEDCIKLKIGIVLFGPENESDHSLKDYFKDKPEFQNIKVIDPIIPSLTPVDPTWYTAKYMDAILSL
ncbi:MAG: hypothetical protein AAB477_02890 [Patescibacteria group bacterium]